MGGLVAMETALTAPKRVRSLSLLCTFDNGVDATKLTPQMLWIGLRTRLGRKASRRRAFLELVCPPEAIPADIGPLASRVSGLFGHDIADQPPVAMTQLAAMRKHSVAARLGELAGVRTLVVSAAHDLIAPPRCGRAIAAGIPDSRYVELDNAAHGVPILEPGRINALLTEHLLGP
jgi:pimeloyl-ACP methyl ester carboxylesterase